LADWNPTTERKLSKEKGDLFNQFGGTIPAVSSINSLGGIVPAILKAFLSGGGAKTTNPANTIALRIAMTRAGEASKGLRGVFKSVLGVAKGKQAPLLELSKKVIIPGAGEAPSIIQTPQDRVRADRERSASDANFAALVQMFSTAATAQIADGVSRKEAESTIARAGLIMPARGVPVTPPAGREVTNVANFDFGTDDARQKLPFTAPMIFRITPVVDTGKKQDMVSSAFQISPAIVPQANEPSLFLQAPSLTQRQIPAVTARAPMIIPQEIMPSPIVMQSPPEQRATSFPQPVQPPQPLAMFEDGRRPLIDTQRQATTQRPRQPILPLPAGLPIPPVPVRPDMMEATDFTGDGQARQLQQMPQLSSITTPRANDDADKLTQAADRLSSTVRYASMFQSQITDRELPQRIMASAAAPLGQDASWTPLLPRRDQVIMPVANASMPDIRATQMPDLSTSAPSAASIMDTIIPSAKQPSNIPPVFQTNLTVLPPTAQLFGAGLETPNVGQFKSDETFDMLFT
jgi:hypothetical protein